MAQEGDTLLGAISLILPGDMASIDKLMVDKNAQGRGIGKFLVNYAIDWSRAIGKKKLIVESFLEYDVAKFYKNCGFTQDEDLGNYKGHPYYCFSMKI